MTKGFKIRIYPTKEQEQQMWQHIGACRYVWNYMLAYQQAAYERGEKHLSGFDMINLLKPLKNDGEHEWLYGISSASLQRTCRDLDEAYKRFFKKSAGFPKFKSRKRSKPSFPLREGDGRVWFEESIVHIPTIGKIKYKTDFDLPFGRKNKFVNPRITFVGNKWMLSFGMECENQTFDLIDSSIGIDLGIKDLAVAAVNGERIVFHNINKSKKVRALKKQLKHVQRSISRKYEANRVGNKYIKTKNIEKEETKLQRIHAKLTNIRNNYIHQTTHDIVSMHFRRIIMEDLNVIGMMKNKHLSKAIQEQCFFEFIRQMKYKCEWNGIEFIQVDRYYPSSKTCSGCGNIKSDLKLKDRTYKCECCGLEIDRDFNAAVNLSKYIA